MTEKLENIIWPIIGQLPHYSGHVKHKNRKIEKIEKLANFDRNWCFQPENWLFLIFKINQIRATWIIWLIWD